MFECPSTLFNQTQSGFRLRIFRVREIHGDFKNESMNFRAKNRKLKLNNRISGVETNTKTNQIEWQSIYIQASLNLNQAISNGIEWGV